MHPDQLYGARPLPQYTKKELRTKRLKNLLKRMRNIQSDCSSIAMSLENESLKDNAESIRAAITILKMSTVALETEV